MIQSVIHHFFHRRHFWRHATFSEVSELYASRLLRIFALRIVSIFTSVYLYQLTNDLVFVAFVWVIFYFLKVPFSWPSALMIAKWGPKHATLISNIVSAVGIIFLPFAGHPEFGLLSIGAYLVLQGFSGALNDLAYLIDFSKVKNMQHAGKEIGFMNIIDKLATGTSPLVGGFLAFFAGPEFVMVVSAVLFLASAVPLMLTAEPIEIHKKLNFRGYPWRTTWRSLVAETAIGWDVYVTGIAWSLFLVVAIFSVETDRVYAEIGIVASIALFVSLFVSYAYGKLIDRRKGKSLMQYGVISNSVVHGLRPFIGTPVGVVLLNSLNEATTAGYAMPFMRGMFDTADLSGKRVEYMFLIEMVVNFGAGFASLVLACMFMAIGDGVMALQVFFVVSTVVTLLVGVPRFALYQK